VYPIYVYFFGRIFDYLFVRPFRIEPDGYIYLIKRKDGIYKIGKTRHPQERLSEHNKTWTGCQIISLWQVPNMELYEKKALKITQPFFYQENGHQELRAMTLQQVVVFQIIFGELCHCNGLKKNKLIKVDN
jgi:hypothetical protein